MFRFPFGTTQELNLDWFLEQWEIFKQEAQTALDGIDHALDDEIQRVEDAMTDLYAARDAAITAKNDALDYAQSANSSAIGASQSAQNSAASAVTSAQQAQSAAQSATSAQSSATNAGTSAGNALTQAQQSEAWATGEIGGVHVPPSAPQNQSNSKQYATNAQLSANAANTAKNDARVYSQDSKAWATGVRDGQPVTSEDETYQNNAKYYAESISGDAAAAAQSASAAAASAAGIAQSAAQITENTADIEDLKSSVSSVEDYIGYEKQTYSGGYELGKISQTTGNNNNSTTRIRTVGFLDNSHDSLIVISQGVQLQVFEYLADGTFNNYYVNLVYSTTQNLTHNAIVITNGVITVKASTQYKYRLDFYNYPTETTIADVNAFAQSNISITYPDVKTIPEALTEIRSDIEELENPQVEKTWVCYGDSLTQMNLYEDAVRNILGITTLYRRGISGCSIAVNSASSAAAGENSSICYRIVNEVNFPDDPDIITILGGINDYYYGTPLGTIDSTDQTTLYGALNAICTKLASLSYNPKIAFITPTKKQNTQAASALDNTITQDQVRKAIIDVANAYGYPVIDLGANCGINAVNAVRETNPTTTDGTHWSELGQSMCIPIIADGIRKLCY